MKKLLIYVLGIITGIVLTLAFAFCVNLSENSGIIGLEMFEEPGENMDYSQFEVLEVLESGCALVTADGTYNVNVLIIPNETQQFYDNQKISIKNDQCAQRVGTYRYRTNNGIDKTVPAVKIVDVVANPKSHKTTAADNDSGKTLFDKPGECVSRKNFKIQKVLESGDAIAREIRETTNSGYVFTSDLEVLILAKEGSNFYNNQIVKAHHGKCARQIGNYKYQKYNGNAKVIPIIAFE